jgi:hypothetical protein
MSINAGKGCWPVDDSQIDLARSKLCFEGGRKILNETQINFGIDIRDASDERHREALRERRRKSERDGPSRYLPQSLHFRLRLLRVSQDEHGTLKKLKSLGCRARATYGSFKKPNAEFGLEQFDLATKSWLSDAQNLGSSAKATLRSERNKVAELAKIQISIPRDLLFSERLVAKVAVGATVPAFSRGSCTVRP